MKIDVLIEHPHGDRRVPLEEWVRVGPGERRLLRPSGAVDRDTGQRLPVSVVPFRYRNTVLSRLFVRLRVLPPPWPVAREKRD